MKESLELMVGKNPEYKPRSKPSRYPSEDTRLLILAQSIHESIEIIIKENSSNLVSDKPILITTSMWNVLAHAKAINGEELPSTGFKLGEYLIKSSIHADIAQTNEYITLIQRENNHEH